MERICRNCKHYYDGLCFHDEMSTRDVSIYDEYIENPFDMGYVTEAVMEKHENLEEDLIVSIIETVQDYLKNNLPRGPMNFAPKDDREFCCKFYE